MPVDEFDLIKLENGTIVHPDAPIRSVFGPDKLGKVVINIAPMLSQEKGK